MDDERLLYFIVKRTTTERTINLEGTNYLALGISIPIIFNEQLIFTSFGERIEIDDNINDTKEKLIQKIIERIKEGPIITSRGYYLDIDTMNRDKNYGWIKHIEDFEEHLIFPKHL